MGSGKSTLGERLAERLGWVFFDLDRMLESAQERTVRDLIERDGERPFRALELETLRAHAASQPRHAVTATGGGIVEVAEACRLLASLGTVVWLRADPQVCVERLGASSQTRPLLDAGNDWRRRYARRAPLYERAAQHVVDTHPAALESSLEQLVRLVQAYCQ